MRHKMGVILGAMVLFLVPPALSAKKTTYIVSNQRFNWVKLSELPIREAERRAMNHPTDIDEGKMREILTSITFSRKAIFGEGEMNRAVFGESAVNFLAVNLSRAFREATATDEIVFSYLEKDPVLILRHDRLTIASAWLQGQELHIEFKKLFAKVTGDVDKRGTEAKAISRSRGLNVSLDLAPGQRLGSDTNELIIDLAFDPSKAAAAAATTTDEKMEAPTAVPAPSTKKGKSGEAKRESPAEDNPEAANRQDVRDPKERLKVLEELKRDGLITADEYQQKRAEILKEL